MTERQLQLRGQLNWMKSVGIIDSWSRSGSPTVWGVLGRGFQIDGINTREIETWVSGVLTAHAYYQRLAKLEREEA